MDHTGGDATPGIPISLPNLKATIGKADVDKKGQADYINWATTLQRLRDTAPGWMAEVQENSENGSWLFPSPKGCSVRVRFRHVSGFTTPWVMQALMDFKNKDVPFSEAGDVAIQSRHAWHLQSRRMPFRLGLRAMGQGSNRGCL